MIDGPRARENLEKLLRLARADAEALRIDITDIERARSAAEASLSSLDEAARKEETVTNAAVDIAAYREGVRARRHNLQTTLLTLADAEDNVRSRLKASFAEVKKLEHLIDMAIRAEKKAGLRSDLSAMDEVATMRARNS